jgi:hypothetical protein
MAELSRRQRGEDKPKLMKRRVSVVAGGRICAGAHRRLLAIADIPDRRDRSARGPAGCVFGPRLRLPD